MKASTPAATNAVIELDIAQCRPSSTFKVHSDLQAASCHRPNSPIQRELRSTILVLDGSPSVIKNSNEGECDDNFVF